MNATEEIVSDTGPLISLERLPGGYQWMKEIYAGVFVPPSVAEELIAGGYEDLDHYQQYFGVESFLSISSLQDRPSPPETAHLHQGERDAIRLALDLELELLIEEEDGRRAAEQLDVPYSGIAGQILIAVQEEVLTEAEGRRQLGILLDRGRLNRTVFDTVRSQL